VARSGQKRLRDDDIEDASGASRIPTRFRCYWQMGRSVCELLTRSGVRSELMEEWLR